MSCTRGPRLLELPGRKPALMAGDGCRYLLGILTAVSACLALLGEGGAPGNGDGTTMFGGTPERNMVTLVAKGLPADWVAQEAGRKNILWVAEIGTRGYTSPIVANGKVFIGTNNGKPRDPAVAGEKAVMMCFRQADGQFLWQITHDMPTREVAREAAQDGLCSTPAVEGNRLYYVTPAVEVICADTDGKVRWRSDLMKDLKVFPCYLCNCSPAVVGDLVYVTTGNGRDMQNELPAPTAPSFVALDKRSGKVVWQDGSPGDRIIEGQWGNPAFARTGSGQVIFPGGDGWLYALAPGSGKPLWKFDCNPKGPQPSGGSKGAKNYLIATPTVLDGLVYVGVGQNPDNGPGAGDFWCLDTSKLGSMAPGGPSDPKAPSDRNSPVVWHYGGPAPKGAPRDYIFGRTLSSCAIHDGLAYVAELDGFIHCLDARTGRQYWEEDLKAAIWGSPYWADRKVYLGTDDGDVHVFAHGKEKQRLAKVEMEESVKGTPVAVGGVLYVLTDKHLYAIASR